MDQTYYDATIAQARHYIQTLAHILTFAVDHPDTAKLLTARLAPDMHPFTYQVHYATFQAEAIAGYLSISIANSNEASTEPESVTVPPPIQPDQPTTTSALQSRITTALVALDAVDKDNVCKAAQRMTSITRSSGQVIPVRVKDVITSVTMPNISFHTAMAYAILRANGLGLGKRDWVRGFLPDWFLAGR